MKHIRFLSFIAERELNEGLSYYDMDMRVTTFPIMSGVGLSISDRCGRDCSFRFAQGIFKLVNNCFATYQRKEVFEGASTTQDVHTYSISSNNAIWLSFSGKAIEHWGLVAVENIFDCVRNRIAEYEKEHKWEK